MVAKGSRALTLVISLIIGAALGYWIGHRSGLKAGILEGARQKEEERLTGLLGANVVYIGPTSATATPDDLPISLSKKDVVYWKPWVLGNQHSVSITFKRDVFPPEAGGEPPFINGQNGRDQVIQCSGETCFSYSINPALKAFFDHNPTGTLTYPYMQKLDGMAPVDGRIIINR